MAAACLLVAAGCGPGVPRPGLGTPRIQDASGPYDLYAAREKPSECAQAIAIMPAGAVPPRPYKELASLSVTCSPGVTEMCDRRIRERACELGADAVVLVEPAAGPNPAAPALQSLVARSGRAIKWQR